MTEIKIPKRVFVVPYRNRVQHKFFFSKYMSFILEDKDDYEILFSHQCDARTFNRGAVKNIGFIAIKSGIHCWRAVLDLRACAATPSSRTR